MAVARPSCRSQWQPLPAPRTAMPRCAARRSRRCAACALAGQRPVPRPGRARRRRCGARAAPRVARPRAAFETRHVEHAYIEPEAGYAEIVAGMTGARSRVHIFACTQTPYLDRDEVASVMGIEPEQVRIEPSAIGGGFGGKLDLSVQPLLAWPRRRPAAPCARVWDAAGVDDSRPPSAIRRGCSAQLACSADGDLLAYDFRGDFNTGAYSSWGPTVANRVPIHASGPYRVPNVRALTRAVITNASTAGAFRGFGVPQSTIVVEALIDELAGHAASIRWSSAIAMRCAPATARRPGSGSTPASACAPASTRCGRPGRSRCARAARSMRRRAARSPLRRGAGIACMWYGIGNTVDREPVDDERRAALDAATARFMLYNGAQEIGQGTYTIMPQIVAQALGVPLGLIDQVHRRHRRHRGRRQVVGVAPDLRVRQRGACRRARPAPAAARATRLAGRGDGAPSRTLARRRSPRGARRRRATAAARARPRATARRRARRRRVGSGTSIRRPCRSMPTARACPTPPTASPRRSRRSRSTSSSARSSCCTSTRRTMSAAPSTRPGRGPDPRRHRAGHRPRADGGVRQRAHRQPARLPDPDRRRRAADQPPGRGSRAARALRRQGRRRTGAGRDGAGHPERDPDGHRRAAARGAGDAEPPARCAAAIARSEPPAGQW